MAEAWEEVGRRKGWLGPLKPPARVAGGGGHVMRGGQANCDIGDFKRTLTASFKDLLWGNVGKISAKEVTLQAFQNEAKILLFLFSRAVLFCFYIYPAIHY